MIDDQPQAAASQFIGCEPSRMIAAGATLPVARTNGARLTHGLVVPLDFLYSRRTGMVDVDDQNPSRWEERETRVQLDLAPPFMRKAPTTVTHKRAGF